MPPPFFPLLPPISDLLLIALGLVSTFTLIAAATARMPRLVLLAATGVGVFLLGMYIQLTS